MRNFSTPRDSRVALRELDERRKRARLAYERAKIVREEADGAVERLKYTALLRHFPSMDDTTRLVLSRIMTDGRCMACNAPAQERQAELEEQVARGCCPICGCGARGSGQRGCAARGRSSSTGAGTGACG